METSAPLHSIPPAFKGNKKGYAKFCRDTVKASVLSEEGLEVEKTDQKTFAQFQKIKYELNHRTRLLERHLDSIVSVGLIEIGHDLAISDGQAIVAVENEKLRAESVALKTEISTLVKEFISSRDQLKNGRKCCTLSRDLRCGIIRLWLIEGFSAELARIIKEVCSEFAAVSQQCLKGGKAADNDDVFKENIEIRRAHLIEFLDLLVRIASEQEDTEKDQHEELRNGLSAFESSVKRAIETEDQFLNTLETGVAKLTKEIATLHSSLRRKVNSTS